MRKCEQFCWMGSYGENMEFDILQRMQYESVKSVKIKILREQKERKWIWP